MTSDSSAPTGNRRPAASTRDGRPTAGLGPARPPRSAASSRTVRGLALALLTAACFGTSGTFGAALMDAGWTPASAVAVRVSVGALVLLVPSLLALRGKWDRLRSGWRTVLVYGVIAVAACQLCYFFAVERMPVGVALLIEYTSPIGVLTWLWLRHGQRPKRLTVAGAMVALVGLALVIDAFRGLSVDPIGVLWALAAMLGAVVYFMVSADESHGIPPIALAGGGLVVGAALLWLAGLIHLVPMAFSTHDAHLAGSDLPWWVPALAIGVISAAGAYWLGIESAQLLGSRLSSFVALIEVVLAIGFAWALVGQVPTLVQVLGGALILGGVVLVKLGEPKEIAMDAPLDEDGLPVI